MAELLITIADEVARRQLRRNRVFFSRVKHLENYDDSRLISTYRFPRETIRFIIEMCSPYLESLSDYNQHKLTAETQVLCALRFFGKGTFQLECGELAGVSQPSASRIITKFCNILCNKANDFITFPASPEEIRKTKNDFYALKGFPNCIGCIDGTHAYIRSPSGDDEILYVNRKSRHSINVQFTCNAQMLFTDVVAKWPGATHDSFMWKNSCLRQNFVRNPPDGWLLGDSGYGIEPWLLTPLEHCHTSGEIEYNVAQIGTRRIVENTIGLLKNTFRCLDQSAGNLQYTPGKVCKIIVAATVLHNIRRKLRLPQDESFVSLQEEENAPSNLSNDEITRLGIENRTQLIRNYFSK